MKTKFLALALVAAAPFAASADVSYSYVDLSYQMGSADPGGVDFDGFQLEVSGAFSDNWFVAFEYGDYTFDPTGDFSDMALFLGWNNDMFFAKLGYEDADIVGFSDSGYALDFGARGMVSDGFELNGHVGYSDLGDLDTFTNYGIGAVWFFGDNMGLSFNYDIRSGDGVDFDSMGVGFRFNFN
jgi:hypothetical protein